MRFDDLVRIRRHREAHTVNSDRVVGENVLRTIKEHKLLTWHQEWRHDVIVKKMTNPRLFGGFSCVHGTRMVVENIDGNFFHDGIADRFSTRVHHHYDIGCQGFVDQ